MRRGTENRGESPTLANELCGNGEVGGREGGHELHKMSAYAIGVGGEDGRWF